TISLSPPANSNGWNNTDVQVSILATDNAANDAGMAELEDRVSGATNIANRTIRPPNGSFPPSLSDSLSLTNEGISVLVADAADFAGLTVAVNIDATPTVITYSGNLGSSRWGSSGYRARYWRFRRCCSSQDRVAGSRGSAYRPRGRET